MSKRIIYQNLDGSTSIIIPTQEALTLYSIEVIALKDVPGPVEVYDVPTGVFEIDKDSGAQYEVMARRLHTFAFKIVEVSNIPSDRTFRNAWEVDPALLTDGVGAESNEFPDELVELLLAVGLGSSKESVA